MNENLDLTDLLQRWRAGDPAAEAPLVAAIYPVLRALAHRQVHPQRESLTLQPTELAHEAFMRLENQRAVPWQNRQHFFAIAARVVRRVVIDYLRERGAEKRGAAFQKVAIDLVPESELQAPSTTVDWLALDAHLVELERVDADGARLIELRYFAGLTLEEIADSTGVSVSTVTRQWRSARAWLHSRLQDFGPST